MAWRYYRAPSKYRSEKVVVDGITFDSIKESRRYQELKLMEKAGEIEDLKLQEKYILIPSQREQDTIGKKGGKKKGKVIERECAYIADFVYRDKDGNTVVEDTKSPATRTTEYIIKRKLMLYIHGIRIHEL